MGITSGHNRFCGFVSALVVSALVLVWVLPESAVGQRRQGPMGQKRGAGAGQPSLGGQGSNLSGGIPKASSGQQQPVRRQGKELDEKYKPTNVVEDVMEFGRRTRKRTPPLAATKAPIKKRPKVTLLCRSYLCTTGAVRERTFSQWQLTFSRRAMP